MKLTPWYPGDVKPARIGVYERNYGPSRLRDCHYCYWNGKFWSVWATTTESAKRHKHSSSAYQNLSWRGVAK